MHTGFPSEISNYHITKEDYSLIIDKGKSYGPCGQIFFQTAKGPITARDKWQYEWSLWLHRYAPEKQYVEVGAGLGGFIPDFVELHSPRSRPIIIDPANYVRAHELLCQAYRELPRGFSSRIRRRLELLQARAALILNTERVQLINTSLETAVEMFPQLRKCADFVICNRVPIYDKRYLEMLRRDSGQILRG